MIDLESDDIPEGYFECEDGDYCDHEEYEIDVCTGRAACQVCGARWWATKEQVDAELDRIADYTKWTDQENRRERWREVLYWLWWPLRQLRRFWPERHDDEIPF
jgi:hypothetical protein